MHKNKYAVVSDMTACAGTKFDPIGFAVSPAGSCSVHWRGLGCAVRSLYGAPMSVIFACSRSPPPLHFSAPISLLFVGCHTPSR